MRPARKRFQPTAADSDGLTLIVSFMLSAAGLAHLSVAPGHFGEWWGFGALFLVAAASQLGVAVWLLLRPSPRSFLAAAAISSGLIAAWSLSRTIGLPFGPQPGVSEGVGLLDLFTTLDEAMLVALVLLTPTRSPRLVLLCEASGVLFGVVLTLAFAGGVQHG